MDITSCPFFSSKTRKFKGKYQEVVKSCMTEIAMNAKDKTHLRRGGLVPKQEAKAIHEEGVRPRWSPGTPHEPSAGEAEHESWVSKA